MDESHKKIFRQEVLKQRTNRLQGDVVLAVPVSWQTIGYALLITLAIALIYLFNASYSRTELVTGVIALDGGVAPITPKRAGIVEKIMVQEGQYVLKGDLLAVIQAEETTTSGRSVSDQALEAIEQQDNGLNIQSNETLVAASAQKSMQEAQVNGLLREIESLDRRIGVQHELLKSAEHEVEMVQSVAKRGFLSRRDLNLREEVLLTRRQQLADLEQQRASKRADLLVSQSSIKESRAQASRDLAALDSSRAELLQRKIDVQANQGYILNATVSGTVTAITANAGQSVNDQQSLMTVVPTNAKIRAELLVPTSAIGFVSEKQEVRLAINAFPYQRFGTVKANISQISSIAVSRTMPDDQVLPVYLVTAELSKLWVPAFGKQQPLIAGMDLSARIVTENQSLFERLFEPLFAVQNR